MLASRSSVHSVVHVSFIARRYFAKLLPRRLRNGKMQFTQEIEELVKPMNYRVVVVGRPNVGKSTFVNRLAGRQIAIVHKSPGMTRDRKEVPASLAGLEFTLIDTPGLEDPYNRSVQDEKETMPDTQLLNGEVMTMDLQKAIQHQADLAVRDADIVLFMYDGRVGVSPIDDAFANWTRDRIAKMKGIAPKWWIEGTQPPDGWMKKVIADRDFDESEYEAVKSSTRVICVANKCEREDNETEVLEGAALGFGDVVQISSEHNEGMAELHAALLKAMLELYPVKLREYLQVTPKPVGDRNVIRLVIAGKPNVGKSTLVNRVIGKSRLVTGDQPGVTRDSITVPFYDKNFPQHQFQLVDTAGLRGTRPEDAKKYTLPDSMAMRGTLESIKYANVVALVIDVSSGIEEAIAMPRTWQNRMDKLSKEDLNLLDAKVAKVLSVNDLAVARKAEHEGRGLLIVANKVDKIAVRDRPKIIAGLEQLLLHRLPQNKGAKIVPVSATEGDGMSQLVPAVVDVFRRWDSRISTGMLNRWLIQLSGFKPHPKIRGRPVRFKYITQVSSRPPSFRITANRKPAEISPAYLRYFINALRSEFKLEGIPIRTQLVKNKNPYNDPTPSEAALRKEARIKRRREKKMQKKQEAKPTASTAAASASA